MEREAGDIRENHKGLERKQGQQEGIAARRVSSQQQVGQGATSLAVLYVHSSEHIQLTDFWA